MRPLVLMSFSLLGPPGAWNSPAHPPTLLYVCAAAVGWCISPYFSSVVSGGRASRATIHTYILLLLLSNGPIHGIKWSLSARARAHSLTLTVVAKREEDGARGQSSILVNSAETVTVSRDRGPLFSIALEGPIKTNLKLTASKAVMGRVTRPYPYPWWSQFGSPGQFGSSVHHLQKICGCCFHNNEIISVGIDQLDITTVTATTAGKRFSNEIVIYVLLFFTLPDYFCICQTYSMMQKM